ncbi:MAG: ATP-binding cassette domain-containing protein [Solirubrobacteraceae bacterium]
MSTSNSPATKATPDRGTADGTLLSLRGVTKRFGPVQALSAISFDVPAGQVTSLAGDNGAGKSVTIKTIAGLWAPDEGELLWEGQPVHFHGPRDAEAHGITTIYQDLALCENLDIVQNMFLGHEQLRHRMLDEGTMELTAKKTLDDLSVTTIRSIRQPVASLSGGQRQSVAVAKAVMSKAKLVILDEPTAALGVAQTRMVLSLIKRLASQGVAVMIVSHNLTDVFAVADRIVILYLGQMVAQGPASEFDATMVVDYMTTGQSARTPGAVLARAAESRKED